MRAQADKTRLKLAAARANRVPVDLPSYTPAKPTLPRHARASTTTISPSSCTTSTGRRSSRPGSWPGRFPAILDEDEGRRSGAHAVRRRAQAMLDLIVEEKWFTRAAAVVGFWPANARRRRHRALCRREPRREPLARAAHPAPADASKRDGRANAALADFVAPTEPGVPDYVGGVRGHCRHRRGDGRRAVQADNDDYSSIMLKALADRLAEAFAERMHERVRRELWGYAADEALSSRGADRREVPRHPSGARLSRLPDHTEKGTLFELLDAESDAGMELTESFAMWPGASVSRALFRASREPLFRRRQDRARPGRGLCRAQGHGASREAERWLAPVLNYIPTRAERGDKAAFVATPANDETSKELASHPPGCTCAVHLVWQKKRAGAG